MKHKGLIFFGGFLLMCFIGAGILGSAAFGYWDFTNDANRYENGIKAKYTDNQNVYDNGVKKVLEIADVPQIYADKVKEITIAAIQGRYGANGSQAVFQTLQEDNPKLDQTMFLKIQQVIEEFRTEFQQNQTDLTSRWQVYNNMLTGTRKGTFYNSVAGFVGVKFPRIDPNKFTIITSGRTEDAFNTKKDERIQLHKDAPAQAPAPPAAASAVAPKREIPPVIMGMPSGQVFPKK